MASTLLFNRVKVNTSTTGTGTITLGAAFSNAFCTFAEAGAANGNVVTYTIEDGNDFEIGRGTYTSSGTTLSRDTVLLSKIGGSAGTSKINLSGAAVVFIAAAKEDLDVNDFTEDTSPLGASDYVWTHDASASIRKKAKPLNITRTGGLQLLDSGTVTNAATLDIVLTSFTTYRAFKFILTSFVPASDDVELWMRLSTDGGANYDATGYSYTQLATRDNNSTINHFRSASDTKLVVAQNTTAGEAISNVASEGGVDVEVTVYDPQATGRFPRARWEFSYFGATQQDTFQGSGSGSRENAQNTDAARFFFESGNIASGNWALYGYA